MGQNKTKSKIRKNINTKQNKISVWKYGTNKTKQNKKQDKIKHQHKAKPKERMYGNVEETKSN